mgnify:CR=1 FL=1
MPLQPPPSAEPVERTLVRDHADGAELRAEAAGAVRIPDPHLQALDVVDSPNLERLDLRGAAPGIVVTVARCPQLSWVRVPEAPPGAEIHWDDPRSAPAVIRIEGAVAGLDAALGDAALRLPRRSGPQPWHGALLTRAAQPPDPLGAEALCWFGPGSEGPPPLGAGSDPGASVPVALSPGQTPAVLCLSDGAWTALAAPASSPLAQLRIERTPALRYIAVPEGVERLEVHQAGALERIEGAGRVLSLSRCGGSDSPVELSGAWAQVHLAHTGIDAAAAARSGRLSGFGTTAVAHALAAHYQEGRPGSGKGLPRESVATLLNAAEIGVAEAAALLLDWAGEAPRRDAAYALQGLLRLARTPAAPVSEAALWQARCRLRRRLGQRLRERPRLWQWDLPADQRLEAESADHWLAVQAHQAGVDVLEALAAEVIDPQALLVVMRQFVSGAPTLPVLNGPHPPEDHVQMRRELAEALFHRALVQPAWLRPPGRGGPSIQSDHALEVLRYALRHILARGSVPLADALADCLGGYLHGHQALPLLEALTEHGHAPSRAQAMAIALGGPDAHPARRRPEEQAELRRQAMGVALAPAVDQQLADGDSPSGA